MIEIIHWTNDVSWAACGIKIAIPYLAFDLPKPIRLQKLFKPKYVFLPKQINNVTCPACIAVLKQSRWYCIHHGFLAPVDVTFIECCAICDNPV